MSDDEEPVRAPPAVGKKEKDTPAERTAKFEQMVARKLSEGSSECLLNDRAITDADLEIVITALKEQSIRIQDGGQDAVGLVPVAKLDLVGNFITDKGCAYLSDFLQGPLSKVTDVDLFGNDIRAEGATVLANALRCGGPLTCVDLRSNPIGPEGSKALLMAKKDRPSIAVYYDDMPTGNAGMPTCPGCAVS